MILIPVLAAVAYGLSIAHYKWLLSRTSLDRRTFLAIHFLTMTGVALVLAIPYGQLDERLFSARYLLLFGLLTIFGIVHNYFFIKGLRRDSLHEYEIIDLLLPVFTILLAALVFVDERDPVKLSLALVAGTVFLATHWRAAHIRFKQADRYLMYAVFIMAIERILVKPLLELGSPAGLYAFRTSLITLVLFFLYRPRLGRIAGWEWGQLSVNGLIGVTAVVLSWISIATNGIVVTELYLLITPMVLAIISYLLFHERWRWQETFAFVVILLCVAAVDTLPIVIQTLNH